MKNIGISLFTMLALACSGPEKPEQVKGIQISAKDSVIRSQISSRLAHHDSVSCKIYLYPETIKVHYLQAELIYTDVVQVDSFLTANHIQREVGLLMDKEVKVARMMALMEVFKKKNIDISLLTKPD